MHEGDEGGRDGAAPSRGDWVVEEYRKPCLTEQQCPSNGNPSPCQQSHAITIMIPRHASRSMDACLYSFRRLSSYRYAVSLAHATEN